MNEVNEGKLKQMGHSLDFKVAETFGEEVSSIRQTAALWKNQVAGYIGPQETCVHEGRMAAAFNLPMISYVSNRPPERLNHTPITINPFPIQFCTHYETSCKKDFPTFARTRPPDTQISKSVVSLLLAYNWTQVRRGPFESASPLTQINAFARKAFSCCSVRNGYPRRRLIESHVSMVFIRKQVTLLYLDSNDDEFGPVAETVLATLKSSGVKVQATYRWYEIYHHGYGSNPFDGIVERSFMDTRSKSPSTSITPRNRCVRTKMRENLFTNISMDFE